jgi:cyclophilin family peptidyl-prolyl cis-trans isomerase
VGISSRGFLRFLSSRLRRRDGRAALAPTTLEVLEGRTLLAAVTVNSVIADNRGEVLITTSGALNAATINKNSVQVYTAGPDKRLATADDTRVPASVRWTASSKRITIRAQVAANTGYRVKLAAARLKDVSGVSIDGEFNGRFPSGNGVAGGNFEFQTKNDTSDTPIVRMSTVAGTIALKMFRKAKPISVANFLSYANDGSYDNIFWTRSIKNFIVQGGSLKVDDDNTVDEIRVGSKITNEFTTNGVIHNTVGTVAFAKQGGDPNSATNQFFINLNDNSSNLDNQNGGFTVFAKVANSASQSVANAIANYATVALRNDLTGHGVVPSFSATGVTDTPVVNKNVLTGSTETIDQFGTQQFVVTGGFNPSRDLIVIRRTALQMRVAALA